VKWTAEFVHFTTTVCEPKGLLSEEFLLRSATILHGSPMGLCPVGFVDLAAMVCGVDETTPAALLASP
jgi:hypothetical protein